MPGKTVNVLFTSVGRRVELLRAFRRAYQSLGLSGSIVALDVDKLAPALRVAEKAYIVPRLNDPAYIPTLVEICQRERVDLIFPLIDPDIPILAANRHTFQSTGARVAVVSEEAARITSDKWLTRGFFDGLGIRTPRSWLPADMNPQEIDYPVFIKPRNGSASAKTFKVNDKRELMFFKEYVPKPIIQEYLSGSEITNDVLCDLAGNVQAVVSRKRIEARWGEVAKGVTVYSHDIAEACQLIARSLPAIGPITVQCILKDGIPHFTEINPRFGGGVPLSFQAGADAPRWLLAGAAGLTPQCPPLGSYTRGLHLTRFDESFFIEDAGPSQIACGRL